MVSVNEIGLLRFLSQLGTSVIALLNFYLVDYIEV